MQKGKELRIAALSFLAASACAASGQFVYEYSGPPVPIPDVGSIEVSLPVLDSYPMAELNVGIILPHTWQGDLRLTIVGPWGGGLMLFDRPGHPQQPFGFSADDYGNLAQLGYFELADAGASVYDVPFVAQPGIARVTGQWDAEGGSLNSYAAGRDVQGTWRLRIEDFASGDIGRLERFRLTVTPVPEPSMGIGFAIACAFAACRRQRRQRTTPSLSRSR